MTSLGPGSRSGSPRSGGGGGRGSGSLTPLTATTPSTSTATAGAVFSALPSCLMPEAFTGEGDFEHYLQQFTTAAQLSGWQTATTDNRPNYFALRLKGKALHFYTTLTVAQQQNFDQLVAAFRTTYTTNVEVLKAKLKAARQQPNQTIAAFLCDIRTLARRVYSGQPLIEEQIVLTSFIKGLHDSQLKWELRKSKPASPDAALALAVELHAFMEMDPSLKSGSQATANMVSALPPQPLMATTSTSQNDMMGTLIQTIRQEIQKALPQTNQNSSNSRSSSTDGRSVRFNSPGLNRQSASTNQNPNYRFSNNNSSRYNNNNQNNRYNNSGNQQNNRYNNNRNTPHQQQNRNNTNQPPCRHCNRTIHQSRDCQACFNCGRIGHMSRECRAPRQNQNNGQQNLSVNQISQNFNQDRKRKFLTTTKYFKLEQSTSQGQHVDDTN